MTTAQTLASLIRQANAQAFHNQLRELSRQSDEMLSLEGETFKELNLVGFDFSDMDLSNTAFEDCTLTDAVFRNTVLEGGFLQGTTLFNCTIESCPVDGLALDACTLSRCELKGLTLDNVEWTDCQFTDCILAELDGEDVLFERLTFRGGKWTQVRFASGEMGHVTLREMRLEEVVLDDLEVHHCYRVELSVDEGSLPEGFKEKTGRRRAL
jgi:uncharacterized protein YjbI with pentapeptide repeats